MTAARLTANAVGYTFRDGTEAVTAVDLALVPGAIRALIGLNGAGKTTLLKLLLGMLRPARGTVDPIKLDASQVGYLIDAPFAYRELTGWENIKASALLHGLGRVEANAAAERIIERMDLSAAATKAARKLSQGNRQRIGLACALVHRPRLIVLDEPTIALDPRAVVNLRGILTEAAVNGAAILVSSHHLDEVARIADSIDIMHSGHIIDHLPPGGADLERRFFDIVHSYDAGRP